MTYSPKGRWIAGGKVFLLMAIFALYVRTARPSPDILPWVGGAFIVVAFALSFRAYFYLDEIQQGERMRAFYYGAPIGIAFSGLLTFYLTANQPFLDVLADIFHHHRPHKPFEYFVTGMMFIMLPQLVGNFVARTFMALAKRSA